MSLIKYTFLYRSSSNDVVVATNDGLFSAIVSPLNQLVITNDVLNVPISATSFINIHYNDVESINGIAISTLGLVNIIGLTTYLNNYCFNDTQPISGGTISGVSGSGSIGFPAQSSTPMLPASGFKLYANSTNALSWIGANGFTRTFDGTTNTADRIYTLPNVNGVIALLSDVSLKQNLLSGSGFVKMISGSVTYDGSTYLTGITSSLVTATLGYSPVNPTSIGSINGVAGLDGAGKIPTSQLPSAILGAMNYQGVWNASTNTPTLTSGTGSKGFYYVVSVAGTTSLDGNAVWSINDVAVFNGSTWNIIQGGITNAEVVTALGYTPYNSSNPSGYLTSTTASTIYFPITGGTLAGTAGSGIITFPNQSANPSTPASGFSLFANSTGLFSWKGSNGFVRTFDSTSNTADRVYTLPDASGTFSLLGSTETYTGLKTYQGTIATDSAPLGAELLTSSNWTSTGWTGSFGTGWVHTTGNTSVLSNTLVPSSGQPYQITYIVTGRTGGTFDILFGGITATGLSITGATGVVTSSTGNLSITPTSTFDGVIIISIKQVLASSALISYRNSAGTIIGQKRVINDAGSVIEGLSAGGSITTGINNTIYGSGAGQGLSTGSRNTFIGNYAGYSCSSGTANTFIGVDAGAINNGNSSTFVGRRTGYYVTTGINNNFFGNGAGQGTLAGSTGSYNNFFGNGAGAVNISGYLNSAFGTQALFSNTSGYNNVALGSDALLSNTLGYNNVAIGPSSMSSLTTGFNNVGLGSQAGKFIANGSTSNTTSSNSIFIGANSFPLSDGQTNQVVIGYGAVGNGSNTTVIGNPSTIHTQLFGTVVLAQTAQPSFSSNSVLDIQSTTRGVLLPRMTTTQRDAITTPSEGLKVYNLTTHTDNVFNGTIWESLVTNTAISGKLDFIASATFSTIPAQTAGTYKMILVLSDETNNNYPTLYIYDGTGLQWLPTSKLY